MPLEKRITVNQIEIVAAGVLQMRLGKIIADGDKVFNSEWHRTSFEVGGDIPAQIAAVNAHLAEMGWPAMPADAVDTITKHAAVAWTPERVAAAGSVLDVELEAKRAELVKIKADAEQAVADAKAAAQNVAQQAADFVAAKQAEAAALEAQVNALKAKALQTINDTNAILASAAGA